MLAYASDAKQPLNLLGTTSYRELLSALPRALVRREQHAKTCRVQELELLEVEHDHRSRGQLRALDLALQERRAGQIEFAGKAEYRSVLLVSNVDPKLILNSHTLMLPLAVGEARDEQRAIVAPRPLRRQPMMRVPAGQMAKRITPVEPCWVG
jgi:hypothetical protein